MKNRRVYLAICDMFSIILIGIFFIGVFPSETVPFSVIDRTWHILTITVITICFRIIFHLYSQVWRYATPREYMNLVVSDALAGAFYHFIVARFFLPESLTFLRSISIFVTIALVSLFMRVTYSTLYDYVKVKIQGRHAHAASNRINIAIVGAGSVGTMLCKSLQRNPASHYEPYCFIDNNPYKIGCVILGLKVLADNDEIIEQIREMPVQEIVIAIPRNSGEDKKRIYDKYIKTGCKVKMYDYPLENNAQQIGGSEMVIREVKIEDLLMRSEIHFSADSSDNVYRDCTVLVTGGGGSIGSELCRQLIHCLPSRLVIFDCYENNAYEIQQELLALKQKHTEIIVEIGSVRDSKQLEHVFSLYKPDIVFHAAAHKHVPLMEHNCGEAIKNNVLGTRNTMDAAERHHVKKFLLISTDKAVNPTNVMGASKRMCEMLIRSRKNSETEFKAVRFGNVLGSNGSVIPLFKRQIQQGGPITLTDKRIIRYFMTIPEAAQLLLKACAMASSGEIYVLDMGQPVKILDLAENMIRLAGYKPYIDIDIKEIGLRPGEKLYEELLIKSEELGRTENGMIFVERDGDISREQVQDKLDILLEAVEKDDDAAVTEALHRTVPTFHTPEEVNSKAIEAEEMRNVAHNDHAAVY
ncbi:MAG: nucleoside-diphosphate sugar epimerase/dehydratase [Eubacteriales bacterium]|nr:nucleoside-diphosphate sugar epimerase/dehydratase [Eubacteriales bacterium]MDD3880634.1 nucleoside-diphosphate sugar epimerase/dehydratase [Eubacteriales bacterium]MDD4513540.1 nucleoside-diphosphate sugar epimerase/dehydratase [Eubacteriales bacterium]